MCIDKLDPSRYSSTDMTRAHMVTYETLIDEEENQILGFSYFGDGANVTIQHVAIWSITEFATLMKWGEVILNMVNNCCWAILLSSSQSFN